MDRLESVAASCSISHRPINDKNYGKTECRLSGIDSVIAYKLCFLNIIVLQVSLCLSCF